ncbi:hypothetical protein PV726_32555 [Streptomyces europaeiscabiei]|uniref:hypothetical protein n=1 Tax=Streptomyces europaeiscabiei TaxID=146819 RepID=UPI0029A8CEDD|nr:hypothetical protein [Streptomyces europaeiscabiei]MDX3694990.1 hypothetical protein [Streptomyces europaeiscabiei]
MGLTLRAGHTEGLRPDDPYPQWSYTGFGLFRRRLARHIGIDLDQMRQFGGEGDWSAVASPLRHLLDHADDRGELTAQQAAELAPALRQALDEIGQDNDPDEDFLWDYDQRAGTELVRLLEVCARDNVPVQFQ